MAIDSSVHTLSIVSNHQSKLQFKKIRRISAVFCHGDKKGPTSILFIYKKNDAIRLPICVLIYRGSSVTLCKKGLPNCALVPKIPKNYGSP
jgi:hypothetical protein